MLFRREIEERVEGRISSFSRKHSTCAWFGFAGRRGEGRGGGGGDDVHEPDTSRHAVWFEMGRPLVRGRSGGKQAHLCSACQKPGHRVSTCSAAAAKLIRLEAHVKSLQSQAPRKPRGRGRDLRKDKRHRAEARTAYSGPSKSERQVQRFQRQRDGILQTRGLLGSAKASYEELVSRGCCDPVGRCPHCGADGMVLSETKKRSKKDKLFAACGRCHKYVNVLYWSAFRGTHYLSLSYVSSEKNT